MPITPPGYWEEKPYAAWTSRLGALGYGGYDPLSRHMQYQYGRQYDPYMLSAARQSAQGQTPLPWFDQIGSRIQDPATYQQQFGGDIGWLYGQPQESTHRGFYEENPEQAWGLAMANQQMRGLPAEMRNWLSSQQATTYQKYLGGAGAEGQTWLDYLRGRGWM